MKLAFQLQVEQLIVSVLSPEVWALRLWKNRGFHRSGGTQRLYEILSESRLVCFQVPKHSLLISAAKWMCSDLVNNLINNIPLFPAIVYRTRHVFAFLK